MPFNLVLGLHMLLVISKSDIALFATSLIMLLETADTTQ